MWKYLIRVIFLACLSGLVPTIISAEEGEGVSAEERSDYDYRELNRDIEELEREDERLNKKIEEGNEDIYRIVDQQNAYVSLLLKGIGLGITILAVIIAIVSLFWRYQQKRAEEKLNKRYEDYQGKLEGLVITAGSAEDKNRTLGRLVKEAEIILVKMGALVKEVEAKRDEVESLTGEVKNVLFSTVISQEHLPEFEKGELEIAPTDYNVGSLTDGEMKGIYDSISAAEIEDTNYIYAIAEEFYKRERDSEALDLLDILIQKEPDVYNYYYAKGLTYLELGELSKAQTELETAVEKEPGYWGSYHYLGRTMLLKGEYREAYSYFDIATNLKPDDALSYHGKGSASLLLSEYGEAVFNSNIAIKYNDGLAGAYADKGIALVHLNEFEYGVEVLTKAISKADDKLKPQYRALRAFAYASWGKRNEMLEDIGVTLSYSDEFRSSFTGVTFAPYRDDPDFRRLVYAEDFNEGEESG